MASLRKRICSFIQLKRLGVNLASGMPESMCSVCITSPSLHAGLVFLLYWLYSQAVWANMEASVHTGSLIFTFFSIIQGSLRIELYAISHTLSLSQWLAKGMECSSCIGLKGWVLKSKAKGRIYPTKNHHRLRVGGSLPKKKNCFYRKKEKACHRYQDSRDTCRSMLPDFFVLTLWFRHEWICSLLSIGKFIL